MKDAEQQLRRNTSISRSTFIFDIIDASNSNTLNTTYLSDQLKYYEEAVQLAVQGNLQMSNTDLNDTDPDAFPVQSEKWTLMQAIFFASTICTTIGLWMSIILNVYSFYICVSVAPKNRVRKYSTCDI